MLCRKVFIVAAHLLFAVSVILQGQQNQKCVAVITGISGDVQLKRAGEQQFSKASWGTQLFNGDQVKTTAKSEANLAFSNNSIIKVGVNSQITIAGEEPSKDSSAEGFKTASAGMMIDLSDLITKKEYVKDEGAIAGVRSIDGANQIELASPVNTFIKTLRPSFSWNTDESYTDFIVTLYDNKGPVWSRKVTQKTLDYPENEKELVNGVSYFWIVEGQALIDTEKSGSRKFTVIPLEKSREVAEQEEILKKTFVNDPESCTLHSLLGAYYLNSGLLLDAEREFRIVSEMNKDASMPHEILGSVYIKTGNKDKAIEELQKALALSKNSNN
jgi:hypothetical protein